jgi:hypothetical protein
MTTLTSQRHPAIEADGRAVPCGYDESRIQAARERLSALLARAAVLDLADAPGWEQLRAAAHATTSLLCAAEALPPHLYVGRGDPPVVVARTIAAAWRRAGASA